MCLGNVEGVEDEDVMVVLGEGHHVALASDLQAAASRHLENSGYTFVSSISVKSNDENDCYLDMRALELAQQAAVIGKHDHVKLVSV